MTDHATLRRRRDEARPTIKQADVALELDVDASAISRFERYGLPLPRNLTPLDYESALTRLIERAREAVS